MSIEMQRLSVSQVLAVYNFHSAQKVTRFESHAAGAKRLRALLAKIEVPLDDAFYATFPKLRPAVAEVVEAPVKSTKSARGPVLAADSALPAPPDFTANTHKPYRAKLAKLVELAAAGDIAGLEAIEIKPTSSSPKALLKYRDKAVAALKAKPAEAA